MKKSVEQFAGFDYQAAAPYVAVAAAIFRGRMKYHIGAEGQRTLQDWRRESARFMRNAGNGGDVHDFHQGVGGRFDPDELRVFANSPLERIEVLQVHDITLDAPGRQKVLR